MKKDKLVVGQSWIYSILVFLTAAFLLASEILINRIFQFREGQNFTSLVISLALLGLGISGIAIALLKKKLMQNAEKSFLRAQRFFLLIIPLCFFGYAVIPLNTLEISWDLNQFIYFLLQLIIMLIFFSSAGFVLGLSFLLKSKLSGVYFANLTGSAFGSLLALAFLHFLLPYQAFFVFLFLYLIVTIVLSFLLKPKLKSLIFLLIILIANFISPFLILKLDLLNYSEYKGISTAMRLPEAKIIAESLGPEGFIQIVEARGLRRVNGLSYNFEGEIPEQKAIYLDGNQAGLLAPFDEKSDYEYLNWCSQSLAHYLQADDSNKTFLGIGLAGGEGIRRALVFNYKKIVVLDNNKTLVDTLTKKLEIQENKIFKFPEVEIKIIEPRQFLKNTNEYFDLIEIDLIDSLVSSYIPSLSESYLYTVESFYECYKRLSPKGILSITRRAVQPLNDALKLISTIDEMARHYRIENYKDKLIVIRSANTVTLCLSPQTPPLAKVKEFCEQRAFDLLYHSAKSWAEETVYFKQDNDYFNQALRSLLTEEKAKFLLEASYELKPAFDNCPYYYNIFKLETFALLFQSPQLLPFSEWGIGLLFIQLGIVLFFALLIILGPAFFIYYRSACKSKSHLKLIVESTYFFFLGLAYFFVEIPLIKSFGFFLSLPIYSFTIVLSSLLFFSGLGSLVAGRFKAKYICYLILILPVILLGTALVSSQLLPELAGLDLGPKIGLALLFLSIPAFLMGIPFPAALAKLKVLASEKVPLAWALNGLASVISSILAQILSMSFGINFVLILATSFYFICAIIYLRYFRFYKN